MRYPNPHPALAVSLAFANQVGVCVAVLVQNQFPQNCYVLEGGQGEFNIEILLGPPCDIVSHLEPLKPLYFEKLQVQPLGRITKVLPSQLVSVLVQNLDKELNEVSSQRVSPLATALSHIMTSSIVVTGIHMERTRIVGVLTNLHAQLHSHLHL